MLRMFARRMSHVATGATTDQVILGWSLPSDTVIHDIRAKVQMIGTSQSKVHGAASLYAAEMWILPVLDPDLGDTYDDIWDALVPKDTDVQTLDLDTQALDTSSFYEPGEIDWSAVVDVGLRPERLYHRHKILTQAGGNALFQYQDSQSPYAVKWVCSDSFNIHVGRRLRVRQPSVLVIAVANPGVDDTTPTVQTALVENEWNQVKYAGNMLERLILHLFGLTEAGAESPWEEATALLQKHLDPDVYEETAGKFSPETFDVYSEGMLDHSVVGEVGKTAVTTGR